MKAAGSATAVGLGLGAFSGSAAATVPTEPLCPKPNPEDGLWFCGCSQIRVKCPEKCDYDLGYFLLLKKEGSKELWYKRVTPNKYGLINVEVSEPYGIVGLKVDEGVIFNPNNCAQKWWDRYGGYQFKDIVDFPLEYIYVANCGNGKKKHTAYDRMK